MRRRVPLAMAPAVLAVLAAAAGARGARAQGSQAGLHDGASTRARTGVGAAECSWVADTDYVPNQLGNVGANLTRQQCCDACHHHSKCTFAVLGAATETPPRSCWLKGGDAKKEHYAYKEGATVCCPAGHVCPRAKPPTNTQPRYILVNTAGRATPEETIQPVWDAFVAAAPGNPRSNPKLR